MQTHSEIYLKTIVSFLCLIIFDICKDSCVCINIQKRMVCLLISAYAVISSTMVKEFFLRDSMVPWICGWINDCRRRRQMFYLLTVKHNYTKCLNSMVK